MPKRGRKGAKKAAPAATKALAAGVLALAKKVSKGKK